MRPEQRIEDPTMAERYDEKLTGHRLDHGLAVAFGPSSASCGGSQRWPPRSGRFRESYFATPSPGSTAL
jgi:hypothetical protein